MSRILSMLGLTRKPSQPRTFANRIAMAASKSADLLSINIEFGMRRDSLVMDALAGAEAKARFKKQAADGKLRILWLAPNSLFLKQAQEDAKNFDSIELTAQRCVSSLMRPETLAGFDVIVMTDINHQLVSRVLNAVPESGRPSGFILVNGSASVAGDSGISVRPTNIKLQLFMAPAE